MRLGLTFQRDDQISLFLKTMNGKILLIVTVLSSITLAEQMPEVTKLVIRFTVAADLPANTSATKPKTLYMAGTRYARIEQETDPSSHVANLIIVNERDIWAIDSADKTGSHSTNPGPDFTIHNPILGTDGPEELFGLEFGREVEFLKQVRAKSLEPKEIRGRKCETRQFEAQPYRIVLYLDSEKNSPVELKAFKDGEMKFTIEYLTFEKGLPFEATLFEPPGDIALSEAGQ
jgi:hypothetical protein